MVECPLFLNKSFFDQLSHDEQNSCIKLLKKKYIIYRDIIREIISWCIEPEPNWTKLHLFGIFIEPRTQILAIFPDTFEKIVIQLFKGKHCIKGFYRSLEIAFDVVHNFDTRKEFPIFLEFIKYGFNICECKQTSAKYNEWHFKTLHNEKKERKEKASNLCLCRTMKPKLSSNDVCKIARERKNFLKQTENKTRFISISKLEYSNLKKKEKFNLELKKQFDLLMEENDFLKQKCNFYELKMTEKNKIECVEKFVHYFFNVFVVNKSNSIDNEDLCLSLLEHQLINLGRHLNHHIWDRKIKALAWHEYFKNSIVGFGVYKLMPCLNTVKSYFKEEIAKYYSELTDIDKIEKVLTDFLTDAKNKGVINPGKDGTFPQIICSLGLDACKVSESKHPKPRTNDDDIITFQGEIEKMKSDILKFHKLISIDNISNVRQFIFLKIILNSIQNKENVFQDLEVQKHLLLIVEQSCPKKPRSKTIKIHDSNLYHEKVNKTHYIDILLNNSNFRDIKLIEPFRESHKSDDQLFVYVLLPLNFELHPIILHISSSSDGHVHDLELYKIIKLLGKLQTFNFSPNFICSDGETGLTKYHTCFFEKFIEKYIDSLINDGSKFSMLNLVEIIFHDFPNCPPIPLLDSLHAVKTARARLINDAVFLNKFFEPLIAKQIQEILQLGKTLDDISHVGKMKDYYAIKLFTLENTFRAFDVNDNQLVLYLLIYSLFLEAFRNNSIELQSRKKIINIIFLFFCKFYKQTNSITKNSDIENQMNASQVSQNKSKFSDGTCFAPKKYLIKIIHTTLALYFSLMNPEKLGLDRITTHIIENFFGLNRVRCRGNNSYDMVLHYFIEGAFDFHLINEFNLGHKISQRDNIGGTKYKQNKWIITIEEKIDILDFVNSFFIYGTKEIDLDVENESIINDKVYQYILILKEFHKELVNANAYKPLLYEPGKSSGKAIDCR